MSSNQAVDSFGIHTPASTRALAQAGIVGALRYHYNTSRLEVDTLHAAGVAFGLIAEFDTRTWHPPLNNPEVGPDHARKAVAVAQALGMPAGCVIWFTQDTDLQPAQYERALSYWDGADDIVRAAGYRVGAYGEATFIDLLIDLQKEMGLAMIFISHDLAVVREISHRVMVLFLGRVMEMADRDKLYADPQHPYTRALLSAAPIPDPDRERNRQRIKLTGEPPSPMDPAAALRFLPSRVSVDPLAPIYTPRLTEVAPGHLVSEFDVDWENRGAA